MPAKEQTIGADQDTGGKPRPRNPDQIAKSAKFVFDAMLSTAVAANGQHNARALKPKGPLTPEMLGKMNRYWRAANYLCIGQPMFLLATTRHADSLQHVQNSTVFRALIYEARVQPLRVSARRSSWHKRLLPISFRRRFWCPLISARHPMLRWRLHPT